MRFKDLPPSMTRQSAKELGLDQFSAVCDGGLELDGLAIGDPPSEAIVGEWETDVVAAPVGIETGCEDDAVSATQVTPVQILEAMLFVDEGPLYAADVAAMVPGLSPGDVESIIASLAESYHCEGRPYEIVASGGGYHLRLREGFQRIADRLYNRGRTHRLSPAAVEVLAVVAYRQPIGCTAVESQRGAGCGALLRQLVQRGVLAVRRVDGSREVVYETTPLFLNLFGLNGLDELPRAEDLEKL